MENKAENVLEIQGLRTYFFTDEGILKAVDDVTYAVESGKTLGVIGESGCGKSVLAQSILQILPAPGRIVSGEIRLLHGDARKGEADPAYVDLAGMDPKKDEIRKVRGARISMVFQEPMTSLSPIHTIGNQMMEALLLHRTQNKAEALEIAYDMLVKVGISNPRQRLSEYPHQLSGGIRQRVMIAMALCCHPSLLIADEPTTALDVTIQAQVLELMKNLQKEFGMSIQYITHDMGVIADIADTIMVMYLGRIIEMGTRQQVFRNPMHPYTELLMKSIPSMRKKQPGSKLESIQGTVPIPMNLPPSCGFAPRCPMATAGKCDSGIPSMVDRGDGHQIRCFLYGDETDKPFCNESEKKPRQRAKRSR